MSNIIRKLLLLTIAILLFKPFEGMSQYVYSEANLQKQLDEARNNVFNEKFNDAVAIYALLVKNSDDKTVSAEYAYALALSGCYDGAIMNLDKIFASGQADKDVLFYTSQVLILMEYDSIANLFWTFSYSTKSCAPSWISGQYRLFVEKYHYPATINTEDLGTALQRANQLAENHQCLQSLVLFLELIDAYPAEYLPHLGLSALLENLGYIKEAEKNLRKGIEKMGEDKYKIDPNRVYEKHLEKLMSTTNGENRDNKLRIRDNGDNQSKKNKKYIYTGITYINKSLGCNIMYGWYANNVTNFSANFGYARFEDISTLTGDLSFNAVLNRINVLGVSISSQYSKGSFDIGLGARAGWAIPISGGNSSVDIMYSVYYYFINKEMRTTLSVGYTHYF